MSKPREPELRRNIGSVLLTLYGLGTILGAGIYVLVGEVARAAGSAAPSAFLLAALIAGITALSYAELASRLPASAGEAAYVAAGFRVAALASAAGWAVIATGIVSAAVMARGFVGYLQVLAPLPGTAVIVALVGILGLLAAWGIRVSLLAAGAVTLLEAGGLIMVCLVAGDSLQSIPQRWEGLLPAREPASWAGVASGAFVAFYAFIGFEDMVNVAEEVKDARRTLPRAILAALGVATALYLVVAVVAVLSMPLDRLVETGAPLVAIVESRGFPAWIMGLIGTLAVFNGALVQVIMASRVAYGLGRQGLSWAVLAQVHPRTRTPVVSTVLVSTAILLLALGFSLERLARLTSFVVLIVFVMVNAALWRLQASEPGRAAFSVPRVVPVLGVVSCGGMIVYQTMEWLSLVPA